MFDGLRSPALGVASIVLFMSLSVSSFEIGITHTQYTADYGDSSSVARARQLITNGVKYQNQHIMGFGALNPEPSPNQYNWGSLDNRINLIRATKGTPVITLCCAPDWMKGGQPGQTNWSLIEVAPTPDRYSDFANLALEVAKRYPDVQYFQVWNEFKGFWDGSKNRWNYEGYTQLYNLVYNKLKAFNSSIQIGGPYITMITYNNSLQYYWSPDLRGPWGAIDTRVLDAIKYWLANANGADFITVDAGIRTNNNEFSKVGLVADPLVLVQKFAAINRWFRNHTDLPIWWAEYYVTEPGWSWEYQAKVVTEFARQQVESGASVALNWPPMGTTDWQQQGYLWNDSRNANGGYPTPIYNVVKMLNEGSLFSTPSGKTPQSEFPPVQQNPTGIPLPANIPSGSPFSETMVTPLTSSSTIFQLEKILFCSSLPFIFMI